MLKLFDGLRLYHGSYCCVMEPDISKCAKYKDFGQGFYLTSSFDQAKAFAKISTSRAIANHIVPPGQQYGVVSEFEIIDSEKLSVFCYEDADKDWLHCIVAHRKKGTFQSIVNSMRQYDVIGGKVANDNTNATIAVYMSGALGNIESDAASDICVGLLLPERLQNQFCFRSVKSLSSLLYKGCKKIWI